jgi:hypothetical protein
VYQEDGSWQATRALRCASSLWVLEATAVMQQSADKGQTVHQTFIYSAVMYGAEVWDTTKAVKDKMSAVVKLSAAF